MIRYVDTTKAVNDTAPIRTWEAHMSRYGFRPIPESECGSGLKDYMNLEIVQEGSGDKIDPSDTASLVDGIWVIDMIIYSDVDKKSIMSSEVQMLLDSTARSEGFDSIHTAVTYADEPSFPTLQTKGAALRAWRSNCWAVVYQMLADYEAEIITKPSAQDVLDALPVYGG